MFHLRVLLISVLTSSRWKHVTAWLPRWKWRMRCPGFKYPLLYSHFLENPKEVWFLTAEVFFLLLQLRCDTVLTKLRSQRAAASLKRGRTGARKHKLWDDRTSWKQAGKRGPMMRLNVKFLLITPPCSEKNSKKTLSAQTQRGGQKWWKSAKYSLGLNLAI